METKKESMFVCAVGEDRVRGTYTLTIMRLSPADAARKASLHKLIDSELEALKREFQDEMSKEYESAHSRRVNPLHNENNSITGPTESYTILMAGREYKPGEILKKIPKNAQRVQ